MLAAFLLALGLANAAQGQSFAPRDECSDIAGADQFRMALATAVANRNADMLKPLVDPHIKLDFGGGEGWELMSMMLDSEEQVLWEELQAVLALGCSGEGDSLSMPWVWGRDLGFDDPFSTYLVAGRAVPLRAASDGGASVVRMLNWEAVSLRSAWSNEDEFALVTTQDGDRGYVPWDSLRSQLGYRLIARCDDGSWKIVTFIAGD